MFSKAKKVASLLLALVMLIGIIPWKAYAEVTDLSVPRGHEYDQNPISENFVSDDNGYIKYFVNRQTGGFYIMPSIRPFDGSIAPSFSSFKINGEEFIFGGDYPNSEFILPPVINHGGTCQSTWRIDDMFISQFLNIVKNDEGENSYAVYIRYEVESALDDTELNVDIEGRILIDTMFGADDNLPVSLPDGRGFITKEITITNDDMPPYFEVNEQFKIPARAYGLIKDETVTPPLAITFARFSEARNTVFNFTPDDTQRILGDSAALLYFEGQSENSDETISFSTIYGFDELIFMDNAVDAYTIFNASSSGAITFEDELSYHIDIVSTDEGFILSNVLEYAAGEAVHLAFSYETIDDFGLSKAIKELTIKDSQGYDIEYETLTSPDLLFVLFEMPASNITVELISSDTRWIEWRFSVIWDYYVEFSGKYNNYILWSFNNIGFAAGNEITLFLDLFRITPGDLRIIGKSSSQEYAYQKLGLVEHEWREAVYAYSFIMPDEDVLFDFASSTASVTTVGEGFEFGGWWNEETGDLASFSKFYQNESVSAYFSQDLETFDSNDKPTKAIKLFAIKDSQGNDVQYDRSYRANSLTFEMPNSDVTIELISDSARSIETVTNIREEFQIVYAEKHNNPYTPNNPPDAYVNYNAVYASGNEVTAYMISHNGMIPGDISVIGRSTSRAYPVYELEPIETTQGWWTNGATVYVYSFIMPDEDVIIGGTSRLDENFKFSIYPDIPNNRGRLSFSGEGIEHEGNNAIILPGQTVTVDVSGIDYVNNDFHGVFVTSIINGIAINITEEAAGERYSFIMPSTHVYVRLDVRAKPVYVLQSETDNADALIELINTRGGRTTSGNLSGYAGDKITFGVTNRDIRKIFDVIQLIDAETNVVLQTFTIDDVYSDYYPGEFIMPARNVILRLEFIDAPPVSVEVDSSIPSGTIITPLSNQVLFNDTVNFDFVTDDGRYLIYRPVLRAYDSTGKILYEEYYQREKGLTDSQTISFSSDKVQKIGGVPASIVLSVYEQRFEYMKQLTSISPNSTKAELFTEIYAYGINMFEGDEGIVYIGTSPNPTQPATLLSFSEDGTKITIAIPDDMRPVDDDVTYYVRINDAEFSCTVFFNWLLRSLPFGILAVVSDSNNNHSIIVADTEAELIQLRGTRNITLKMIGDLQYNPITETYDYENSNVLFNNIVTYRTRPGSPMRVKQISSGVEITASGGEMTAPGFAFVDGEPIAINLRNGIKYIDSWAKNDIGNYVNPIEQNIVVEYTASTYTELSIFDKVKLSNAALLNQYIIFSGNNYVGFNVNGREVFSNAADIIKIEYKRESNGNYVYQGYIAKGVFYLGSGNLTNDFFGIPGLRFDNNIEFGFGAYINTFAKNYYFDMKLDIDIAQLDGMMDLLPLSNGWLFPDSFRLSVGTKIPIPPPPLALLFTVNNAGGGFSNLVTSLNGNFSVVPPVTIDLYGSGSFVTLLSLNDLKLSKGPLQASIEGKLGIGLWNNFTFDIIKNFKGGYRVDSNGAYIDASASIDIWGVIKGDANLSVSQTKSQGFRFNGSLYSKIEIPSMYVTTVPVPRWGLPPWKDVRVYTPSVTLWSQKFDISNESVSTSVTLLDIPLVGKVKVHIEYKWGASMPVFKLNSSDLHDSIEAIEPIYDENGMYAGYASYGSNLGIAAISGQTPNFISRLQGNLINPTILTNEEMTSHTLTFPENIEFDRNEYVVIVSVPQDDISIIAPDGKPFILRYIDNSDIESSVVGASAISYVVEAEDDSDEDTPMIMIYLPKQAGSWTIRSSQAFASSIIKVAPLPEIEEVSFNGADKITWCVNNLNIEEEVYVLEVRMSTDDGSDRANTDPGTLIDEIIIDSSVVNGLASGVYTIDLDQIKDFESGDYYPRLVLLSAPKPEYIAAGNKITDDVSLMPRDSMTAITPLVHSNSNEPASVASVSIFPGGGGALRAEWQAADDKADGYIVRLLGENGNPIYMESDVFDENSDVVDTSLSQIEYGVPNDLGEDGSFSVLLGGMPSGVMYRVEVIPYANIPFEFEGEEYHSTLKGTSTLSNLADLPVPSFPVINTALPGSEAVFDGMGNRVVYVNNSFDFGLSSNLLCKYSVLQDGNIIYSSSDHEIKATVHVSMVGKTSSNVQIIATNAAGDTAYSNFIVYLDDIAPVLFVITDEENTIFTDLDGHYVIKGYSEKGAVIQDDLGNRTTTGENGEFSIPGNMSQGTVSTLRSITAMDSAGNTSTSDILITSRNTALRSVTGTIKSYNPSNATTITLIRSSDGKTYTASIASEADSGQKTQDFIIDDVESGTYTLVITKDAHTKFTVQSIIVGDNNVDLTEDARPEVRLMTLRCGDLNGDGLIDDRDLTILWLTANYFRNTSQAANPLCDFNGDGVIDDRDLTILWLTYNYFRGEVVIQ